MPPSKQLCDCECEASREYNEVVEVVSDDVSL